MNTIPFISQRVFSLFFASLGQKGLWGFLGEAFLFSVALGQARAESETDKAERIISEKLIHLGVSPLVSGLDFSDNGFATIK